MRQLRQVCTFEIVEWHELSDHDRRLLVAAIEARGHAIAPYSSFKVGAAIISSDSKRIFRGFNVEDVAFNGTEHAETSAMNHMIAAFGRDCHIQAIALALGHESTRIDLPPERNLGDIDNLFKIRYTPCGHCRTVLSQHALPGGKTRVLAVQPNGQILVTTLRDLYPLGFSF